MLDPREPSVQSRQTDPLSAVTVGALSVIAVALFAAAFLATYTYSTPNVELPLVIAIALLLRRRDWRQHSSAGGSPPAPGALTDV